MDKELKIATIRGVGIGVVLIVLDVSPFTWQCWFAVIALSIIIVIGDKE